LSIACLKCFVCLYQKRTQKQSINLFNIYIMSTLRSQIENAQTSEELEQIIRSIPKQENGDRTELYRRLDDAFWYIDIETLEQQKAFMLKRL